MLRSECEEMSTQPTARGPRSSCSPSALAADRARRRCGDGLPAPARRRPPRAAPPTATSPSPRRTGGADGRRADRRATAARSIAGGTSAAASSFPRSPTTAAPAGSRPTARRWRWSLLAAPTRRRRRSWRSSTPTSTSVIRTGPGQRGPRTRSVASTARLFSFHAISPNGSTLYLTALPRRATEARYEVREFDLGPSTPQLRGLAIVDPDGAGREDDRHPVSGATSADGRWAYTLYGGGERDVHPRARHRPRPRRLRRPAAGRAREPFDLGLRSNRGRPIDVLNAGRRSAREPVAIDTRPRGQRGRDWQPAHASSARRSAERRPSSSRQAWSDVAPTRELSAVRHATAMAPSRGGAIARRRRSARLAPPPVARQPLERVVGRHRDLAQPRAAAIARAPKGGRSSRRLSRPPATARRPRAGTRVLVFGCIHGDECAGSGVAPAARAAAPIRRRTSSSSPT